MSDLITNSFGETLTKSQHLVKQKVCKQLGLEPPGPALEWSDHTDVCPSGGMLKKWHTNIYEKMMNEREMNFFADELIQLIVVSVGLNLEHNSKYGYESIANLETIKTILCDKNVAGRIAGHKFVNKSAAEFPYMAQALELVKSLVPSE